MKKVVGVAIDAGEVAAALDLDAGFRELATFRYAYLDQVSQQIVFVFESDGFEAIRPGSAMQLFAGKIRSIEAT